MRTTWPFLAATAAVGLAIGTLIAGIPSSGGDITVAEGVSGSVPYRGKVGKLIGTLMGGVRSAMSYCDAHTVEELWTNAEFIRVTPAGLTESHPHATLPRAGSPAAARSRRAARPRAGTCRTGPLPR